MFIIGHPFNHCPINMHMWRARGSWVKGASLSGKKNAILQERMRWCLLRFKEMNVVTIIMQGGRGGHQQ